VLKILSVITVTRKYVGSTLESITSFKVHSKLYGHQQAPLLLNFLPLTGVAEPVGLCRFAGATTHMKIVLVPYSIYEKMLRETYDDVVRLNMA
jgi:hypothetical protein